MQQGRSEGVLQSWAQRKLSNFREISFRDDELLLVRFINNKSITEIFTSLNLETLLVI